MCPGVDLSRIRERFDQTEQLDEIIPLIDILARETDAIMQKPKASQEEFELILRRLGTVRVLLGQIDLFLAGQDSNSTQAVCIRDLALRCLDIEGVLKKARNDLAAEPPVHRG